MRKLPPGGSLAVILGFGLAACAGIEGAYAESERNHPYRDSLTRLSRSTFNAEVAETLRSAIPAYPENWYSNRADKAGDNDHTGRTPDNALSPEPGDMPEELHLYLHHYGIASAADKWHLGTVAVSDTTAPDGFQVALQSILPAEPDPESPVVLLIHGYFDHTATNRYAIEELLDRGYRVVAMDMPGHGLSSGKRGRIEDFGDYGRAVHAAVDAIRNGNIPGIASDSQLAAIGHSTGASAVIEYLETGGDSFGRLIFVAPLVRIVAYPLARVGIELTSDLVDHVPRLTSGASTNEAFIEFSSEYDPLSIDETSLKWADAYIDWEESRRTIAERQLPLLLVQAGRDSTVDTEYNSEYLKRFFPNTELIEYEDARHNVFNEPVELRPGLYDRIHRFLSGR